MLRLIYGSALNEYNRIRRLSCWSDMILKFNENRFSNFWITQTKWENVHDVCLHNTFIFYTVLSGIRLHQWCPMHIRWNYQFPIVCLAKMSTMLQLQMHQRHHEHLKKASVWMVVGIRMCKYVTTAVFVLYRTFHRLPQFSARWLIKSFTI